MNFGQAIENIKAGGIVAREGWNGKGMHLHLTQGSAPVEALQTAAPLLHGVAVKHFYAAEADTIVRMPHITMRTAQGTLVPWLASQSDMLAEDWINL